MIASLRGKIERHLPGEVTVDVAGVGYSVHTPTAVWEALSVEGETILHISTYVREDRFELYGFSDRAGRALFEAFIGLSGIGPKLALELCNVPKAMLLQAIDEQDPRYLTSVKGVGRKTAEKLLVELRDMAEKHPAMFATTGKPTRGNQYDQDAVDALRTLGYDTSTIMKVLQNLPADLGTTEERVAHALRAL